MTARVKASVKAQFQTGDKPTQADFEDFVDSYEDKSDLLAEVSVAVSAAVSGLPYFVSATDVSVISLGSAGRALVSADGKASALAFLVDTASAGLAVVSASTKASITSFLAPISANNFDAPWIGTLTSAAPVSADFVPFGDANDSNNQKRMTVQNLLDLVPSSGFTQLASPQTLSGADFEVTGIPAGTTCIVILINQASGGNGDNLELQIGDSGGVENTGYTSAPVNSTDAFTLAAIGAGSTLFDCVAVLYLEASNTWFLHSITSDLTVVEAATGRKALSGTLDRISLGWASTTTFDAGTVTIRYL